MTSPAKRKGDRAELEVQAMLRDHLGVPARRALGAGRRDDVGDINGVPNTVIQVVDWRDVARAVREKPDECEQQRLQYERQIGEPAFAATFVRLRGGRYVVALTPDQFFALWREAA
jgi:hypothetical protein